MFSFRIFLSAPSLQNHNYWDILRIYIKWDVFFNSFYLKPMLGKYLRPPKYIDELREELSF
jgi:hypothetical protein